MIRVLRGIRNFITSPLGRSQSELQDSLASNWMALKLCIMHGHIDPGAPIYVGGLQPARGSGYMTLQSVLKTVEDSWGLWDRKTTAWWCQVLERANNDLNFDG